MGKVLSTKQKKKQRKKARHQDKVGKKRYVYYGVL